MPKGAFGLPGIQVRGKLGGMIFIPQADGRMTVRRAPTRVVPPTARQKAGAARFRPVAEAWNSLSIEEGQAWRRYGQGLGAKPDGRAVQPNNAFTALATKWLQMRPSDPIPRLPPTEGFLGDGIRVSVSPVSLEDAAALATPLTPTLSPRRERGPDSSSPPRGRTPTGSRPSC